MRKRVAAALFALFLVLALCLPLSACGSAADAEDGGRLKIIATIFPQYDFAKELGGDNVSVQMLLPPGAESHSFEPTPQDIIDIQGCDLFIYVGGESESWVSDMLDSMGGDAPEALALTDCVSLVTEELVEGMQAENDNGSDDDAEYDEHVWTSPKNAITICKAISERLRALDPAHTADYRESLESYLAELYELDELLDEVVSGSARDTIIVGDRFPFRYLAEDYGLGYYAAFPGCSSESEPSFATVAFLIEKVEEENIPAVFYIEFSTHSVADAIAEATGAETLLLHSCHNVTQAELDAGASYVGLMTQNAENLRKALN